MNARRILRRARRRGYLELTRQMTERLFTRRSVHFPMSARRRSLMHRWRRECELAGKVAVVASESVDGTWSVVMAHPDREVSRAAYKVAGRLPVTTLADVRRVVRELGDLVEVARFAAATDAHDI
ncbi:MAG: hypothetical protein KF764_11295 [Labilithrix sp.]|nr:hypothetical protein [Labilithrix sp.]